MKKKACYAADDLLNTLANKSVTRMLCVDETPLTTGDIYTAMERIVGSDNVHDYVVHIGTDNYSLLKTIVGFQPIATFLKPGSFRLVVIHDGEPLLAHRGMSSILQSFLMAISPTTGQSALKVVINFHQKTNQQRNTLKKLLRSDLYDAVVTMGINATPITTTRDRLSVILDRVISEGMELSGDELKILLASHAQTIELLHLMTAATARIAHKKNHTKNHKDEEDVVAHLEDAKSDLLAIQLDDAGTFNNLNMSLSSAIRILSTVQFLKTTSRSVPNCCT